MLSQILRMPPLRTSCGTRGRWVSTESRRPFSWLTNWSAGVSLRGCATFWTSSGANASKMRRRRSALPQDAPPAPDASANRGLRRASLIAVDFAFVVRQFVDFFESHSIRYAVIGGLALQAWGSSRFTRDVDFAVERTARDGVVAFAESLGFETLHLSEGYSNHFHADRSRGRVDFMYVDPGTAEKLFRATSRKPVLGDLVLPVPAPEHLLAMKALAMKNAPQRVLADSADVQFLLRLPGTDRTAVRDYFARHGLLELFDAIEKQS